MGSRLRSSSYDAARRVLGLKVNVKSKRLIRELLGEWVRGRLGDGEYWKVELGPVVVR
jgi:hypothetical protein